MAATATGKRAAAAGPSKGTLVRWDMGLMALIEAMRYANGAWSWPEEIAGSVRNAIRRLERKVGALSASHVERVLKLEWTHASDAGECASFHLVQQVELALTRQPAALLVYFARVKFVGMSSREQLALLYIALHYATDEDEESLLRGKIHACAIASRGANPPPGESGKIPPLLLPTQREAFEQLLVMARLFFEGANDLPHLKVRPRNAPLLVGPTGVGKTFLVEAVARASRAHFIKVSVGDWVPAGASNDYKPTLYAILDQVVLLEKCLLFLDEFDKWGNDNSGSWARSCQTDLWQLLDRAPALDNYQRYTKLDQAKEMDSESLRDLLRSRLWIVAAGTWQTVFRPKRAMGFVDRTTSGETQRREIASAGLLPQELLARFNPDWILLSYPSPEETEKIFEESGIRALADRTGVKLDARSHDWSQAGMRSLEDLATQLLLRRMKQVPLEPRELSLNFS